MSTRGYAVEITNLCPNATEKDVYDFFALCGAIQQVEFVRASDSECTAYVTFRNPHAVETAVLLSGDTILDRPVCITQWGHYEDDDNLRKPSSWNIDDEGSPHVSICPLLLVDYIYVLAYLLVCCICNNDLSLSLSRARGYKVVPSAGRAVSLAQDAVKTIAAKGYVLGKGAVRKAKALGESHQVPSKVAELSQGIGLTGKIFSGVEAARSVDQRYHISGTTKSAMCATRNAVVNSEYFSKGALWLSGALNKASQVAGDLGSCGVGK